MKNEIVVAFALLAAFNLCGCTEDTPVTPETTSTETQDGTAQDGSPTRETSPDTSQSGSDAAGEAGKEGQTEGSEAAPAKEPELTPAEQEKFQKQLWSNQTERARFFKRSVDENSKAGLDALKKNDLDTAEKMFLVALAQIDNMQGQDLREAVILNNLASVYEEKQMYYQSLPLYSRAQKLFIRAQGRKYPAVAMTLSNIGRVLAKQSRWPEAASVYRTAVELIELRGDNKSEEYVATLKSYINALRMAGEGQRLKETEEKLKKLEPSKN